METNDLFLADCGAFDLRDRFTVVFNGTLFFDSDSNVTRVVERWRFRHVLQLRDRDGR
jgi:hypothetical protein